MSQDFDQRIEQMRSGNPAKPVQEKSAAPAEIQGTFHSYGNVRNLCLAWPCGNRSFFNYAYLIRANYHLGEDLNVIHLGFSGQNVIIKGYCLEKLFTQLIDHLPRTITALDTRYISIEDVDEVIVTDIQIETQQ
ncbi:hypothetical protein [Dyadobacter sp. CY323]|uniref:hypothetical protein n=1 Tax=Dyadobacter sp. CY323 TaxID=2907302 RepID=UPI001F1BD835|nr:hypothetical protein [Dyadobacter sp. CY323]MCE6989002.1 hypothetical protein [Dyadobacter sp. CY323]